MNQTEANPLPCPMTCLLTSRIRPAAPDPGGLAERELRQWRMPAVQLFGTGQRWRPLDDVLALLWAADAWRVELLAGRCERRLHPLPWALPVPLQVHGRFSRTEIEAAYCCEKQSVNGSGYPPGGDSLAVGAADPGGLAAGDGVGGVKRRQRGGRRGLPTPR